MTICSIKTPHTLTQLSDSVFVAATALQSMATLNFKQKNEKKFTMQRKKSNLQTVAFLPDPVTATCFQCKEISPQSIYQYNYMHHWYILTPIKLVSNSKKSVHSVFISTIICIIDIFKHQSNLFPVQSNQSTIYSSVIIIIINPWTTRVAGAPQMILQPVFSIFPCSPLPSGTCRTPGLSIP